MCRLVCDSFQSKVCKSHDAIFFSCLSTQPQHVLHPEVSNCGLTILDTFIVSVVRAFHSHSNFLAMISIANLGELCPLVPLIYCTAISFLTLAKLPFLLVLIFDWLAMFFLYTPFLFCQVAFLRLPLLLCLLALLCLLVLSFGLPFFLTH